MKFAMACDFPHLDARILECNGDLRKVADELFQEIDWKELLFEALTEYAEKSQEGASGQEVEG